MSESYPHHLETGLGLDDASAAELQRVLARLKQEQVQLVADQRQIRQQRANLEQLRTECESRQRELQQSAASLEREREVLLERSCAAEQELRAERGRLQALQESLDAQTRNLRERERQLACREEQLAAEAQALDGRQRDLDAREKGLQDQQRAAAKQRAALDREAAELRARGAGLAEQLAQRELVAKDLTGVREQLQQQAADLARSQELLSRQEADLRDRGIELDAQQEELRRQTQHLALERGELNQQAQRHAELQRTLDAQKQSLAQQRQVLERREADLVAREAFLREKEPGAPGLQDSMDQAARTQQEPAALNRRLEGVQAELVVLREQKQTLAAERDELRQEHASLADRYRALQGLAEDLAAGQPAKAAEPAGVAAAGPADPLAMIAAHAAKARSQPRVQQTHASAGRRQVLMPMVLASLAAVLTGVAVLAAFPAEYWLRARVVLPTGSVLAERSELTQAQREVAGRLLEAKLSGAVADRVSVTADFPGKGLIVQVLSAAPARVREGLRGLLDQYRKDLQGQMLAAQQTQVAGDLARRIDTCQAELKDLAARKADLQTQAAALAPQEKAYSDAAAAADKARRDLDELRSRSDKVSASLRVLLRTSPGSKAEVAADRLEAESARDGQLVAVRGQVAVRGAELRDMLAELVQKAIDKCGQMESHLDRFIAFLDAQAKQIPDETLRGEIKQIAGPSAHLRKIVEDSRRRIDDLSAAIAKAQDVGQARQLVSLHGQSEKALESIIEQATEASKQIEALLEKIPAGGQDVTRRTVLQQRLRAQFSLVQRIYQEMTETLNGLRPSVNFRLDAALSGVEGLARQLDERQKALLEQIQQQDARQLRARYDKQVQDARAELDDYGIQRDRVLALLTAASDNMLQADAGRSQALQLRGQIADVERQMADRSDSLAAARKRWDNLAASASQPAPIVLEGPEVQEPAVNSGRRLLAAVMAACVAFAVVLAAGMVGIPRMTIGRKVQSF